MTISTVLAYSPESLPAGEPVVFALKLTAEIGEMVHACNFGARYIETRTIRAC